MKDLNVVHKEWGERQIFGGKKKTRNLKVCVARLCAASQHEERKLVRFID